MTTISERIKFLRKKHLKLTQTEFASKLGLSQNAIARYESADRQPGGQTITSICREFGVNRLWLEKGIEPMEDDAASNVTAKIDRILAGENETAKAVFKAFAELSEDEWTVVSNIIDKLLEQKKKTDTD